jgi:hypothetical protein
LYAVKVVRRLAGKPHVSRDEIGVANQRPKAIWVEIFARGGRVRPWIRALSSVNLDNIITALQADPGVAGRETADAS